MLASALVGCSVMLVGTQFCRAAKGRLSHIFTCTAAICHWNEVVYYHRWVRQKWWDRERSVKREEAHERARGHLHLFCMCVPHSAVCCALCHESELPVTTEAGRWKQEEVAGKRRAGEQKKARIMSDSQSRIWVTSYLQLHSDTEDRVHKKIKKDQMK